MTASESAEGTAPSVTTPDWSGPERSDLERSGAYLPEEAAVRAPAGPETVERVDAVREPLFAPARRPGRRVVRIVRHVQLWSVFKVALLGGLVFYAIFLIAMGVAWSLANATGQVHHIEQFMRQIGFDNWSFDGAELFRASALAGAVLLVAGSIMLTLGAAIVNLIAEATGGIRFTVIEADATTDDDDPR